MNLRTNRFQTVTEFCCYIIIVPLLGLENGDDPNTAWEKAKGQYGRVADAAKIIDPRKE